MFEGINRFFRRIVKPEQLESASKDKAKERLHLVLMQDRANVSADFLELMKQEIIDVIKKYVIVDEKEIDVRLTNQANNDGTTGAPALYANIPIINIRNEMKAEIKEDVAQNEIKENHESKIDIEAKAVENEKIENKEEIANIENTKTLKEEKTVELSEKSDVEEIKNNENSEIVEKEIKENIVDNEKQDESQNNSNTEKDLNEEVKIEIEKAQSVEKKSEHKKSNSKKKTKKK